MHKKFIRSLAACMTCVMIITSMDLSVFAAQNDGGDTGEKTVVSLSELDESTAAQYLGVGSSESDIVFPETLGGYPHSDATIDDAEISIPVTWTLDVELSAGAEFDSSVAGEQYVYTAEMTEETQAVYQLADDVDEPVITVTILSDDEMVIHQLQVRIDALPTVDEFSALTGDEVEGSILNDTQLEVYMEAGTIADEIYELDEEQQALLDTTKMDELLEYFNSMTEETAVTLNELPGARSASNSAGDVFLGGNYIELGISKGGSFGTSTLPTDNWTSAAKTAQAFHANPYNNSAASSSALGMVVDNDGWNVGNGPTNGDFFLPGTPEERWVLTYNINGSRYDYIIADKVNYKKGTWKYAPYTMNTSSGDQLSALVTGVTSQNVKIEMTYSFGVNDRAYLTDVVITNNGTKDISEVYFCRSFDPDQDYDLRGTYNTNNKVVCNPTSDKEGGDDNYALVVAKGPYTGVGFFFLSADNRARVSVGVGAPTSAQNIKLWKNALTTSKTYADENDLIYGYTNQDTQIAITFNIGTIAQGASDSFQYTSSLDADVASSLDKYVSSKTKVDVSGLALEGMTMDDDGNLSGTYDGKAFVPDTSGVKFTSDGSDVDISEPKFTYKYYKKVNGKWVELTEAPTDAGDYKVVATLDDDTYSGGIEVPFTIAPKPVTIKNIAAKDKIYNDTTVAAFDATGATIDGLIEGDTVTIDSSSASAAFADKKVGTDKTVTFTGLKLTGAKASNYMVQSVDTATAAITRPTITLPTDMVGYTLKLDDVSDEDWDGTLTLHFSFKAEYGKQSESAFGILSNGKRMTLTAADDGYTATLSGVYLDQTVTVTGVRDVTYPKVKITVGEHEYDTLKEYGNIKFDTFFKTGQKVEVSATDAGSGVASTVYYMSNAALATRTIRSSSITWKSYENSFSINPDQKYVIYARAIDNAGNITYVSSDGLVLHATAPKVSGIENGKTYTGTTSFTVTSSYLESVTIDGKTATPNRNGTYSLVPKKEPYKIKITDKAGNVTELEVTVDWNQVNVPTVSDKVYNGKLQVAALSNTTYYYVSANAGGVNAGTYTAELTLRDTVNYRWADKEGGVKTNTVSYKITKATPTVSVKAVTNLVYNGLNQALVEASTTGGKLMYSLDDGKTWTETLPTKRDAGTYTVKYKVEEDKNYVAAEGGSCEVTIAKKTVTVTNLTAEDKVYDGNTTAVIETTGAVFNGIVSGDTLSVVTAKATFASKDVKKSGSTVIAQTVTISGLTLTGDDAANYVLNTVSNQTSTTAKIMPREVSVNITPNGGVYGGTIKGAEGTLSGCVSGDNPAVAFTYTGKANDGTAVNSTTIPKKAGTYTATASINDANYVLTGTTTAKFEVSKAEAGLWINQINEELTASSDGASVTFSLHDESKNYVKSNSDGAYSYASSTDVATIDKDGKVTISKAGTTVLTITQAETANYLPARKQISIKVDKDGVKFTITTAGYYITYGDNPFTIAASANVDSKELTYESSIPEVVSVDNNGKVTVKGLSKEGLSYESDGAVKVTVTIKVNESQSHTGNSTTVDVYVYPKSITVTPNDVRAIYGGAAPELSYSADGLVGSDKLSDITVKKSGDGKYNETSVSGYNVGTYTLTASETTGANPNYKITFKEGAYTITPKTIGISWDTKTFTYDGKTKTPKATITGLASGDESKCSLTVSGGQVNANSNTTTAYTAKVEGITGEASANYVLPSVGLTQSFTILPKTVGLTWTDDKFTYDGKAKSQTATVTGLVDSDTCKVTTYAITGASVSSNQAISAGSYTVTATALDNANYKLPSDRSVDFTIDRVVAQCTSAPSAKKNMTYDGTSQALVEGGSATGGTFMYSLDGVEWSDAIPTARKAGTYKVYYKVAGDANHADTEASTIDVTISKKAVTVSGIKGSDKTYDGTTDVTLDYTGVVISGIVSGDDVTVTANGVLDSANAGTRTVSLSGITLSGYDADNYELADKGQQTSTTVVVSPNEVTVDVIADDGIYGGQAPKISAEVYDYVDGHKPDITLTYSGTANDGTKVTNSSAIPTLAGSYKVTATIADKNYTLKEAKTEEFIIDRASPNLSVEAVKGKTYSDEQFKLNVEKKDGSGAVSYTSTKKVADVDNSGMVSIKNVGTETITVSVAQSANYTAQTTTISFVVSQAEGKISVDKLDYTVTYGDEPFKIAASAAEGASVSFASKDISVATVSADGIVTIKGVGKTEITLSTSGSKNYNAVAKNISIKVEPKKVTVTPKDVTITYGTPEVTELTYVASGLVGDDTLNGITVTRAQSGTLGTEAVKENHAGVYKMTATEESGANPNYSITFAEGTYTIQQKEISIIWSDTVFAYTGKPQSPKATASGLIQGESCELTVSGANTNAGTYTATVTALDNSNYKLPEDASVSYSIRKKAVTVTVEDAGRHVSDTKDPKFYYKTSGLPEGETLTGITITREPGTEPGTYTMTATQAAGANADYAITFVDGTFTIVDHEPVAVTAKPAVSATCTETGLTQEIVCAVDGCGIIIEKQEVTEALGHDWSGEWTTVKEATATTEGRKEMYCARGCGQKQVEVIPCIGEEEDTSAGTLEKAAEVSPEAPIREAVFANTKKELLDGLFTDDQKEQIADGASAKVWIEISKTDEESLDESDKAGFAQKALEIVGSFDTITYFDLDLFKKFGNDPKVQLHEAGMPIRVQISIPEELRNTDSGYKREYSLIRLHIDPTTGEHLISVISDTIYDEATGELSFETDKFSTYAIVYKDTKIEEPKIITTTDEKPVVLTPTASTKIVKKASAKTGDANSMTLWMTLFMLSAMATVMVGRKKIKKF